MWGFRYSSEGRSRSLFHSTDVSTLRSQYPDNPLLHVVSDDARLIVSEPLGDLRGAWREVPEATCVAVSEGARSSSRSGRPCPPPPEGPGGGNPRYSYRSSASTASLRPSPIISSALWKSRVRQADRGTYEHVGRVGRERRPEGRRASGLEGQPHHLAHAQPCRKRFEDVLRHALRVAVVARCGRTAEIRGRDRCPGRSRCPGVRRVLRDGGIPGPSIGPPALPPLAGRRRPDTATPTLSSAPPVAARGSGSVKAAVGQQPAAEDDGCHEAGQGDGGPDRGSDRPRPEPVLLARHEVGCHRGEPHRQVFDPYVAEDVVHPGEDLLGPDGAGSTRTEVEQAEHVPMREAAHPLRVGSQSARRVEPSDERAHGAAGDADDLVAALLQDLEDADVGVPAGAAATERHRRTGSAGELSDVACGHAGRPCRGGGPRVTCSGWRTARPGPTAGDSSAAGDARRGTGREVCRDTRLQRGVADDPGGSARLTGRGEPADRRRTARVGASAARGRGPPDGAGEPRRRFRWRSLLSAVLIVVGCVLTPVAGLAVWTTTRCPTPRASCAPSAH